HPTMKKKLLSLALIVTWISSAAALEIGDPAPALRVSEWIKGDKVELDTGKIYVVEFWATWCPPCKFTIPHLNELNRRFKDRGVVFVSISNEDSSTVKPFVKEMGDKMQYTVAVDDHDQTTKAYLGAFGVSAIPRAFVINKEGRVIWNGHPRGNLRE